MILSAVLLTAFAATGSPPTDNPLKSRFDRAVDSAVTEFFKQPAHVGLSLAVYQRGHIEYYNYGTTSKDTPTLPTRKTLYEIASITKTFTGAVAAKALLDHKMSLDGDFRAYLQTPYPNLEKNGKPITLRSLATHTSGLPKDIPDSDAFFQHPDFDKLPFQLIAREGEYDTTRYLRELHDVTLASEPGSKSRYSNIGIKLISFGLENVYGRPYADLLYSYITGPLKMRHTGLAVTKEDTVLEAQGYSPSGKLMPHTLPNAGAAGGLYSSAEDMMKYASWQLAERDPIVKKSHTMISGDAHSFGNGLIWDEAPMKDGQRRLWHSGGSYGMSSQLILLPDAKTGFVLLANDGGFETQMELDKLAMAVWRDAGPVFRLSER